MDAVTIENLYKVYKPNMVALNKINLTVKEGDFFGLLGPNGAGKTTTIGILTSLINKTSGVVKIFGHDIDKDLLAAKSCIGVVPQEYNMDVFENVLYVVVNQAGYYGISHKLAMIRAEKYLRKLDLWDKRKSPVRALSGGMKRRLMIARALVNEPKLLILDEPTAGVDIELRHAMWKFLQEINASGTTIILTTHYLEEAEHLCRNIAIIDKGGIVERATTKQLLQQLQFQAVILDLKEELIKIPEILGFDMHLLDPKTLEVTFNQSKTLNELFVLLNARNINVSSMRNKNNRLEEIFMNLVKREAHTDVS